MKSFKFAILSLFLLGVFTTCQEKNESKDVTVKSQQKLSTAYYQTTKISVGITTPNEVSTSIVKLKFIDGAPIPETAEWAMKIWIE